MQVESGTGWNAEGGMLPHDCHVHMALDGDDWKAALARHAGRPDEAHVRKVLAAYADAGFAYLRDGGDNCDAGWLARGIAHEYDIEYVSPCFAIHEEGSYGGFLGRSFADMREFETLVDEVALLGGDFVKVMLSGIMDFDRYGRITGKTLSPEMVRMMVAYAHARGFAVMAHVNGARAIEAAVEAGVDSVEHGYFSDEQSRRALARSGAVWVPTLSPVANLIGAGTADDAVLRRILNEQVEAVREVAEQGGLVALGSEAGSHGVHHVGAAGGELQLMHEALGESCEQVLSRGFDALRSRFARRDG